MVDESETLERAQRKELVDLYKMHVEEIRFQVKFNWDRTQYLLVFSVAILGVSATVWKPDASPFALGLVLVLFGFGAFIAFAAQVAMSQAHLYYRRAVLQKTKFEIALGLHEYKVDHPALEIADLSISTTGGMARALQSVHDPKEFLNAPMFSKGQVGWYIRLLFKILFYVNLIGAAVILLLMKGDQIPRITLVWTSINLGLLATLALGLLIPGLICTLVIALILRHYTSQLCSALQVDQAQIESDKEPASAIAVNGSDGS